MPEHLRQIFEELLGSFVPVDGQVLISAATVHYVQNLVMHEYDVYHAAGAPYGDSVGGFACWLGSASRLTRSA